MFLAVSFAIFAFVISNRRKSYFKRAYFHSHEVMNGYCGRLYTSGVDKSSIKQLYRSWTSYISIELYMNVLQSDWVWMKTGNTGISYLNNL